MARSGDFSAPRFDVRERALVGGVETLHDVELLALLLGTGTRGASSLTIAATLLEQVGGLGAIDRLGAPALATRRGVGTAKATRILAALELGRRLNVAKLSEARPTCGSFLAVADWAHPRLAALEHEEVWVLSLDGRNGIKGMRRVALGGVHGCALTAREILRPVLLDAASAFVLVHNHPSGDPSPSEYDVHMTRAVATAADVVGLALVDHVIVARDGAQSLAALGVLP
jgi:DNA repair protein RadC